MSTRTNGFAQGTVLKVAYSMLGLTSSVVLARIGLNIAKPKRLTASDYFVFAGFAFYVTKCALYIAVSPHMQRVYGVVNGEIAPYPELAHDAVVMTKMVFAAFNLFWGVLWAIKCSLLLLYRKLLVGLSRCYTIVWWGIVGICVLTFFGNYHFYFKSCGTPSGFWTGGCGGKARHNAQLFSLYFSFVADTSTNLMIMALPIWLTWSLQMPRRKKISMLCLFGTGFVCILFACLRVTQVAVNASKPEAVDAPLDPTWLAIWGMVECSIAVIIGCCPAFAVLTNSARTKASYDSHGYRRQADSDTNKNHGSRIELGTIGSRATRDITKVVGLNTIDLHWLCAQNSQEELRVKHGSSIMVSTTVTQDSVDKSEIC
ncbi:hypothetical protein COCVIDRAFT_88942 [Bipolaris victoriae FI3]|uniref:Rhodopsin domain-containing protein n=1 Tax=Bipolaris victoriae (strain FI3) TaxID=930091 RepID=W7EY97_BIPV3|nr:hypothetical protein COCVIDRAFT_88942 [Bipolaris victoriae FI3]